MKECSICVWVQIVLYLSIYIYMYDVQTLSFETNYNYLFCITKYTNRQQNVYIESYADTDLGGRFEPSPTKYIRCAAILWTLSATDLHHTTIFTRWRYHYKLHGINIHLPIYSMSCGSNTIHVLLLLLLLQPLQRSKHRTPIRKTGRNRKIVIICGYKLAVAANEFEPVGGLCTLLAFHLI